MSRDPSADYLSGIVSPGEGYRAVFAALNTPVFIADTATGMLLEANAKAEELVGIPVAEIRLMHHTELHPKGDRERVRRIFNDLVSVGGGTAVVPCQHRNGRVFRVEVRASVVVINGTAVILGIFEDATRKEAAEQALIEAQENLEAAVHKRTESFLAGLHKQKRELEERYRAFLENPHGMVFRTLMDFTPVLYVGGVKAITGYEKEDFTSGRIRWDQIVHPGDMERVKALRKKCGTVSGFALDTEIRIIREDRELRWIHLMARPFQDESGKAVGIEGTIVDITDRKRIESLLHESEEQYRALVENINVGVFRTSVHPKGRFLRVNAAFARIFGYESPAEIRGRAVTFLYQEPADRAAFLAEILDKGFVKGREVSLRKKDGTPIFCALTGIAIRDPGGAIRWIEGILEDITERKRAEEALRESELRYRTVFENTGTAMLVIEEDTTISLVNNEYEKLTGYTREETEGIRSWRGSLPQDELAKAERYHNVRRKEPTAAPRSYETRIKDRFGNEKDILVTVDMIPGTGKSIASIADITQQKTRERDLRASEERFRVIFESAQDLIFLKDVQSRYLQVNPAMARIIGLPAAEIVGKTDEEILGEKAGRFTRGIDGQVLAGEIVEDEYFQPIRGRGYTFHVIRVPLRDTSGNIIGIMGISRDVTDRKRIEAELIRQARELEDYNATLRILLKNRDQEREEMEKKVLSNIHELVFPYLEKMRGLNTGPASIRYLDIIEKTLGEITSSFAHHLIPKQHNLTAKEIQIANLIREGKTTKDIAQILNLSLKTIEFHRNGIRVKLGLKDKKTHLRVHLLGLS